MTRCYFSIENRSDKTIECINHRGSDWGWRNNMTARPNNGSFEDVATMSCPSRFESDHWGWLYFKAYNADDLHLTKYFTVFARLRHAGDINELGMGWTPMSEDMQTPDWIPERSPPSDGRQPFVKQVSGMGSLE